MEQHFDTDQQVALIKVLSDLVTNPNTPDDLKSKAIEKLSKLLDKI